MLQHSRRHKARELLALSFNAHHWRSNTGKNGSDRHRHSSCCAKRVLGYWNNSARMMAAALLTLCGLGCASGNAGSELMGGAARETREHAMAVNRAEAALQRFRFAYEGPACVRVMDSPTCAAYSWADGTICLTTGLIRLLDDDEIGAVIAHELGHLGHAESGDWTRFALGGTRTEDEQRADAVGIILLRTSGIVPTSLAHALAKVRDAPLAEPGLRQAMTNRISRLPW
jgi:hypothetical protein